MLRWRLLLGTLSIAVVAGLMWLDSQLPLPGVTGMWFLPLILLLAVAGTQELLQLVGTRGIVPHAPTVYCGVVALVLSNWFHVWWRLGKRGLAWPTCVLTAAVLALIVAEMIRFREPGRSVERLACGVLALVYVGWFASFLCQIRLLGSHVGLVALASLLLVVKLGDIGAYTVGRLVGRHKLVPRLSPGKTWEGLVGGLAASCLGAWLAWVWLFPAVIANARPLPTPYLIFYGLIVGLAGVIGDLAESLLKRDLGRKDSSTWMPGFGGVLDMIDSLLLAAPVAYLLSPFMSIGSNYGS